MTRRESIASLIIGVITVLYFAVLFGGLMCGAGAEFVAIVSLATVGINGIAAMSGVGK